MKELGSSAVCSGFKPTLEKSVGVSFLRNVGFSLQILVAQLSLSSTTVMSLKNTLDCVVRKRETESRGADKVPSHTQNSRMFCEARC